MSGSNAALLISIQVLDGIAAGVFNVVSVLVIADRTRGSGRFNFALAAVTTAVGIGAALSQSIAGSIAHHVGTRASFGVLSASAALAFVLLLLAVPETRGRVAPAQEAGR